MINLLSDNKKKELRLNYKLKIAYIAVLFLVIALSIFVIVLGSFYILLSAERSNLDKEILKITKEENIEDSQEIFLNLDTKLTALNEKTSIANTTELIDMVTRRASNEIKIEKISFSNTNPDALLIVNGTANTRDSLIGFIRSLEEEGIFKKVNSPISNLSSSENISFKIDITLKGVNEPGNS